MADSLSANDIADRSDRLTAPPRTPNFTALSLEAHQNQPLPARRAGQLPSPEALAHPQDAGRVTRFVASPMKRPRLNSLNSNAFPAGRRFTLAPSVIGGGVSMRLHFVIDFDGTVALQDTTDALLGRFANPVWLTVEE